jgi:ABC-type transport system involved in multi-copper enzyme maturation permease subunit
MNVLPVIARELRLRSRQKTTYWTRCAVGGLAMMAAIEEMVASPNSTNPGLVGQSTFRIVTWLGFLLACGCALVTADTLSRERREGTLGLLLLTKLKGYDIVLGKLCASALTASFALFGLLPALGLVVLAGGVSQGQLGRTSLALLDAIFLCLSVGMWVSSRSEHRGKAMRKAMLAVLLVCAVPRILMYAAGTRWIACLSPLTPFYLSSDLNYIANPEVYWTSLALIQIEGWVLLAWTGSYVWKNWQRVEWSPKPLAAEWQPVDQREAQALAATRKVMLNEDPICWAVSRLKIQSALWLGTLLLILGGTGFSWGTLMSRGSSVGAMGVWDSLHLLVSLGSAALLAWAAGRFLFETQRNGELELLLTTPMGGKDVVSGNWRALCQPLRGAWLLVVFMILIEVTSIRGANDTFSNGACARSAGFGHPGAVLGGNVFRTEGKKGAFHCGLDGWAGGRFAVGIVFCGADRHIADNATDVGRRQSGCDWATEFVGAGMAFDNDCEGRFLY